jgi:hypothetical protein
MLSASVHRPQPATGHASAIGDAQVCAATG